MLKQVIGAVIEVILMVLLAAVIGCLMALASPAPAPSARTVALRQRSIVPGVYKCNWATLVYRFEFLEDSRYICYHQLISNKQEYVSTVATEVWVPYYHGVWKYHRNLLTLKEKVYNPKAPSSTYFVTFEVDPKRNVWRGTGRVEGMKNDSPPFFVVLERQ